MSFHGYTPREWRTIVPPYADVIEVVEVGLEELNLLLSDPREEPYPADSMEVRYEPPRDHWLLISVHEMEGRIVYVAGKVLR